MGGQTRSAKFWLGCATLRLWLGMSCLIHPIKATTNSKQQSAATKTTTTNNLEATCAELKLFACILGHRAGQRQRQTTTTITTATSKNNNKEAAAVAAAAAAAVAAPCMAPRPVSLATLPKI